MRRILECTGALVFLTASAHAGEQVILTSGFAIHADRHEVDGAVVRIYVGSGVSEIPANQIAEYRVEEYTPPPPAPAPEAPKSDTASAKLPSDLAKPLDPHELIRAAVAKYNLPPKESEHLASLLEGVVKQESGFHNEAISPKGAIGFMQLMPGTAQQLHADPHDPAQNIQAGATYLTQLLTKYQDKDDQILLALAAYNAGPGAVDKYNGIPPYRETRNYIRRIVQDYLRAQKSGD